MLLRRLLVTFSSDLSPIADTICSCLGSVSEDIHKMLYLVGLGLADERDITVKGLEVVKRAERVYLEAYTAVLLVDVEVLVRGHLSGLPLW
jgi:hypothetical protein